MFVKLLFMWMNAYRKMVFRQVSIVHCRKRVVPGLTVQIPVRMCMMLLCHFPMNRPKIQQCCEQVNLESCTIGLQMKIKRKI